MKILYRKDKKLTLSNVDGFINIYKSDYSKEIDPNSIRRNAPIGISQAIKKEKRHRNKEH